LRRVCLSVCLCRQPLTGAPPSLTHGALLTGPPCFPQIQFLYASLGSAGGSQRGGGGGAAAASWRAALAALKADYEKNYKYTGKV
jgi:hypothetical protein